MSDQEPSKLAVTLTIAVVVGVLALSIGGCMWGWPQYEAYKAEMRGEATLREARMERQALIAQAEAERESAELRAEAIEIVGQASQDYPEYRTQEFIGAFAKALEDGNMNQIIYVPTEANIPITEAGRFTTPHAE